MIGDYLKTSRKWTRNLHEVSKREGKVVPVFPLTEHHAMKAYWVSGGTAPPIL
jgi:hypothetical protein